METKKKIYIIISGFFLFTVFLVLFCIYPLLGEIAQNSKELISQKNERLLLESQFTEVGNFKQQYEGYKPNLDKIDGLFVDSKNPVGFIEYLEKTASESGIALKISTPSLLKEAGLIYEGFQFSASGGYSDILIFIKKLEAGPYLIQIQTLNIANAKSSQTGKQVTGTTANISIKAFAR